MSAGYEAYLLGEGLSQLSAGLDRINSDRKYFFTDSQEIRLHCQSVKTLEEFYQLEKDARNCARNNVWFKTGAPGVWALDWALEVGTAKRWMFMTPAAYAQFGLTPEERELIEGFTILS